MPRECWAQHTRSATFTAPSWFTSPYAYLRLTEAVVVVTAADVDAVVDERGTVVLEA